MRVLYRDTSRFKNLSKPAGYIFFAQRFEEATFHYTLDSYRAPSVNIPSLFEEALEQLSRITSAEPGVSEMSLTPILTEARSRLPLCRVSQEVFKPERHVIDLLKSSDITRLNQEMPVLSQELSQRTYINEVMGDLLVTCELGSKRDIENLTLELVSTLINMGVSRRHLYQTLMNYFFPESGGEALEDGFLKEFFAKIYPHLHGFDVCFKVNGYIAEFNKENLKRIGVELSKVVPAPFSKDGLIKEAMATNKHERILKVSDVRAYDAFSAVAAAEQRINFLQHLFRIFHHKTHFEVAPRVAHHQLCCTKAIALAYRETATIHSSTDMRPVQAANRLSRELRDSRVLSGPDGQRFRNIAEFHSMSLDASSPQNQLLNLWICLETISPSISGKSKIDSVLAAIVPSVSLLYFRRIFGHLYMDLIRWNKKIFREALKEVGQLPDHRASLAKLILGANSEHILAKLFNEMNDFELLRWRCFRLRSELSSPEKALKKLSDHEERVRWQVRRIYRARNSVVHQGTSPKWLQGVVDTAHEYFDQAMELCSESTAGSSGMVMLEQAFQYVSLEHKAYLERLGSEGMQEEDFLVRLFWTRPTRKRKADVIPVPTM